VVGFYYLISPTVAVWPGLATKDHAVTLSPLPSLGWGGEWKKKSKTRGSGQGQAKPRTPTDGQFTEDVATFVPELLDKIHVIYFTTPSR